MFIPPINPGQFQPSPATIAEWVYQIWQFLQDNPIATETEIREFIQSEITQSDVLANAIDEYLTENPPPAPVQSVQGKTGAVQLAYNDIVTSANAVPVYKASSTPTTATLTGQYNLGYRLFVNTTTQEIYTISPAGALSLVGRGNFDGTSVDVNSTEGDTTIAEAITSLNEEIIAVGNVRGSQSDGSVVIGSTTYYYKDVTLSSDNTRFPRVMIGVQFNTQIETPPVVYVTNVSVSGFRILFTSNSGNLYVNYAALSTKP